MKVKNLIASITLGLVASAGLALSLSATSEAKAVSAEAAPVGGALQYFNSSAKSDWKDAGAVTKVWVSGSASQADKWVETTNISGFLYSFTLPESYTKYTIARLNPDDQSWSGNWGQFHDVTFSADYNYIISTGESEGKLAYTRSWLKHFESGDKLYATPYNCGFDWFEDSAISRISFWDGTSIDGTLLSDSSTIVFEATADIYTNGFNIYRLNPLTEAAWNQTDNFEFTSANASLNAYVFQTLSDESWEHFLGDRTQAFGDNYLAVAYAIHFLNSTKATCAKDGESADHSEALSGKWSGLESVYNALLSDSSKKEAFINSTDEIAVDAKARYSHIIARYPSLDRFINGVSASYSYIGLRLFSEGNNSNIMIIVAISAAVTVAAISAIIIIKKKKHN